MKKFSKMIYITLGLLALWVLITVVTQFTGKADSLAIGDLLTAQKTAVIIYNPDPFYDFDRQICESFAEGLAKEGVASLILPTNQFKGMTQDYSLYVFCANTYNYAPDWNISRLIRKMDLNDKPTVAITVGAGTTNQAQRKLENRLLKQKAKLIDSRTYWVLRPNEDSRIEEDNVVVARDMADQFGMAMAQVVGE